MNRYKEILNGMENRLVYYQNQLTVCQEADKNKCYLLFNQELLRLLKFHSYLLDKIKSEKIEHE
jgi:hypothetical protein